MPGICSLKSSCDSNRSLYTPEKPHQLSRGVEQLFVNGVQVLRDGRDTAPSAAAAVGERLATALG
jgi:hypothetical protein